MIDVKHSKIKETVENCYSIIKKTEENLAYLRSICEHPETEFVNYMWAPGHIMPNTKVCSVCGEIIQKEGWSETKS